MPSLHIGKNEEWGNASFFRVPEHSQERNQFCALTDEGKWVSTDPGLPIYSRAQFSFRNSFLILKEISDDCKEFEND